MKVKYLRNLIHSLIVLNIWTLYCLFNSYEKQVFYGFILHKYFLKSIVVGIFFGISMIVLKLIFYNLTKFQNVLKSTFIYSFLGVFNLWLFAIESILLFMKIIAFGFYDLFEIFVFISPLLISIFIFIDLFNFWKVE